MKQGRRRGGGEGRRGEGKRRGEEGGEGRRGIKCTNNILHPKRDLNYSK